jgi:aminoglycoside phosphotransferase (APT) family kinase protein
MSPQQTSSVPDEHVGTLLRRWLPHRTVTFTRAESGGSTPVYRVVDAVTGQVWYLRLAEDTGESRAAEAIVHQLLRDARLPVPEVLAWEPRPPELDRSAMLTGQVPGQPLRDLPWLSPSALAAAARAAGRDLAQINRVTVRGFGWVRAVSAPDNALLAEHHTRSEWTAEYAQAMAAIAASGLVERGGTNLLRHIMDRWLSRPDRTASSLAHGDFDATHIYAVSEPTMRYSGIIDFGEIRGADPLYDLGHALFHDTEPDRRSVFASLFAGYQAVTSLDADALSDIQQQAVAIGVRRLAIAHRRGSPATTWLADRLSVLATTPADALLTTTDATW